MYSFAVARRCTRTTAPIKALKPWAEAKGLNPYAVQQSIGKKGTPLVPFFLIAMKETKQQLKLLDLSKKIDVKIKKKNDLINKAGGFTDNAYPFGAIYENREAKVINEMAQDLLYQEFLDNIIALSQQNMY